MYKAAYINLIITVGLVILAHLGFGIANAYVASQTTTAKGECGAAIWYCVMVLSIVHFLAFVFGLCEGILNSAKEENKKSSSNAFSFVVIGINIWACVAYFDASNDCSTFYKDNFGMLWNMLLANVIHFFVSLGMIFWICCSSACLIYAQRDSIV